MAYLGHLSTGEQLQIVSLGSSTVLILLKQTAGQQQSQQSSLQTGAWSLPPTLFRLSDRYILRVETTEGQFFVQIQSGQLSVLTGIPKLLGAEILPLQAIADSAPPPSDATMPPLKPLPPLRMGNMSMQLSPMQMQMGDMQMQIGNAAPTPNRQSFCVYCGNAVKPSDRFCANCGQALGSGET